MKYKKKQPPNEVTFSGLIFKHLSNNNLKHKNNEKFTTTKSK